MPIEQKNKPNYDYILIDCAPSLNVLALNALTAADSVLIPTQPEFFSNAGLQMLLSTVSKVRKKINPSLNIEAYRSSVYTAKSC